MPSKQQMSAPWDWIDGELAALEDQGLRRARRVRQSPQVAGLVQLDGHRLVNFGANDYLDLAADDRLVTAVRHAIGQLGWGAGSSPFVSGYGVLHAKLEREVADFEGTAAALLFPTGFATNLGAITALVDSEDAVFSDELNHASIIDGCRLSRAKIHVYRHGDVGHLQSLLKGASGVRRRLIVTDSLFSMDGDFAPLAELVELARRYDAMLMVDEAHATGVWGPTGRGLWETLDESAHDFPAVRIGTFSKALGSMGGFVAGAEPLVEWIANRARSYLFSTAMPESIAAASLAALHVVLCEPERRTRVVNLAADVRQRLVDLGANIGRSTSQIIPIIVGECERAVALSRQLFERGLFVPAIRPPSVPPNQSRLRLSISAAHTDDEINRLVEALAEIGLAE